MGRYRKGVTWREAHVGVMLALPFVILAAVSMSEVWEAGSYWVLSRRYIRHYCYGVMFLGLAISSLATPRILADVPDSARLRGWANFLIGMGYIAVGVILKWYLLSKRDYQHPTLEPFMALRLLGVAWIILTLSSLYALRLERRAGSGEPGGRQQEGKP